MIAWDVVETGFAKRATLGYKLSVLLDAGSLSYLVEDDQEGVLVLRSYPLAEGEGLGSALERVVQVDSLLQSKYGSVMAGVDGVLYTLVPEPLFDVQRPEAYLEGLAALPLDVKVLYDKVEAFGAYVVYAVKASLAESLAGFFSEAKLYHATSALLHGYAGLAKQFPGAVVFVHVRNRVVQITVLGEGGALRLCNSYAFESAADFIYYVMLVFNQLDLDPEGTPVALSGQVLYGSEIYHKLYRYVRYIHMVPLPASCRVGQKFGDTPPHFFFDLYSLPLCG